ncbi:transposase [Massilia sp. PAMC28688]|nr:transposase [Massilia sp. PAMC28688]
MKKIPKPAFTTEFREPAVKRVVAGETNSAVAKELGLSDQTLRNWVNGDSGFRASSTTRTDQRHPAFTSTLAYRPAAGSADGIVMTIGAGAAVVARGTALFSTNVMTVRPSATALMTMPATHLIVSALPRSTSAFTRSMSVFNSAKRTSIFDSIETRRASTRDSAVADCALISLSLDRCILSY